MRLPDEEDITEDGQSGPLQPAEAPAESAAAHSDDDDAYRPGLGLHPQPMLTPALEPTWTEEPHDLPPIGYLFVLAPAADYGAYVVIHQDITIGRAPHHDLRLPDPRVSETHARLKRGPHPRTGEEVFILYDFGTPNGTFVNGEAVFGATVLLENDDIIIGGFRFVFKVLAR